MNATNKPIDILLSAKSVQLPEADNRDYGSSYSNTRENSFDRVLDDQRRIDKNTNRQSYDDRADDARRSDQPKAESQDREANKTAGHVDGNDNEQAKVESKDGNESGNALPDKADEAKETVDALAENFAYQVVLQQSSNVDQALVPSNKEADSQKALGLSQPNSVLPITTDSIKPGVVDGKLATEFDADIKYLSRLLAGAGKPEMIEGLEKGIKLDVLADKGVSLQNELKALLRNFDVPVENLKAAKTSAEVVALNSAGGKTAENRGSVISNLMHSLQAAGLTTSGKAGISSGTIQLPVSSPNWGQAVAQRIAWLAGSGVQTAQLQLNPQELGPVDVRINVSNEQASITFTSQHGAVRDALNQSLDSLREMLEDGGLSLVDVNVSDQSLDEGNKSESESAEESNRIAAGNETENETGAETEQQPLSLSLIDYYA
jgi:flagellar hook-length control protein FliK